MKPAIRVLAGCTRPTQLPQLWEENTKMTDAIRYEKGQDNIVVLTMDMPGQSANTMNAVYREAMGQIVDRLEAEKDSIAGVIVTMVSASPLASTKSAATSRV